MIEWLNTFAGVAAWPALLLWFITLVITSYSILSSTREKKRRRYLSAEFSAFALRGLQLKLERPTSDTDFQEWHAKFDNWYHEVLRFLEENTKSGEQNLFQDFPNELVPESLGFNSDHLADLSFYGGRITCLNQLAWRYLP